jgi:DNA-binding NtrC family response regulator
VGDDQYEGADNRSKRRRFISSSGLPRATPAALRARILVVDDDPVTRRRLAERLSREHHEVTSAGSGAEALAALSKGIDCVLLGYGLPDCDALELLRRIKSREPEAPVIMLTAHSSVGRAVEAMQQGAFHFAAKPIALDEVLLTVERALETTCLRRELKTLRGATLGDDLLVGASPSICAVRELIAKIARSPGSTVLITGESGTGKDLAAKAIHVASRRAGGAFLTVNCSTLPSNLLESELFGHESGAFTDARTSKKGLVEIANGGTLFLDEIGDMELGLQAKLLQFIEKKVFRRLGGTSERRANVRVIAATNVDLRTAVRDKIFRNDLYYRLEVLTVEMPPLRERDHDVELLAKHFTERFSREFRKQINGLTDEALRHLATYGWPGNVRELRNAVERAVLLADPSKTTLRSNDFPLVGRRSLGVPLRQFRLPREGIDLRELERSLLEQALARVGGNRLRAGALLGLNRDQVRYRIKKLAIDEPKSQ